MEEKDLDESKNVEPEDSEFVRKSQSNMIEMTKKMFNNSLYSDVKIIIDHKVIKGHKLVLLRNPSFSKMFASNPDLKTINFSDQISDSVECDIRHLFCDDFDQERRDVLLISSEARVTFLRYLYGAEIKKEIVNLDLMLVAYNYTDEMLKDFCQNYLIKGVNVRNAVRTLLVSLETHSEKLKLEACKLISRNFNEMKFNQDLNVILKNKDTLSEILNVFDDCKTILLDSKVEDANLEDSLDQLRSSDLLMTVGDYHFLAHKNILSERNAVFKVIIDAASSDGFPTSVNIPDVDLESFTIFLHYIYTDKINDSDISEHLLKLAHTYTDDKLKDICEKYFLRKLDYENAIELLLIAMKFECKHLQKCVLNYIVVRYDKILSQDDYQKLLQSPDATNVLIRTLCERHKTDTEKAFFNGQFILQLPTDLNNRITSEKFTVNNDQVYVVVRKQSFDGILFLSIYLYAICPEPECFCYSVKLISTTDKKHYIILKTACEYKKDECNSWGLPKFVSWSKLEDPEYGYIQDGKITLEVEVTAV